MAKRFLAPLLLIMAANVRADEVRTDAFLADVILARPVGLVATICGSALFVAISPLTALATISPPHDAFELAANKLILAPATFTFDRPVGALYPNMQGQYQRGQ